MWTNKRSTLLLLIVGVIVCSSALWNGKIRGVDAGRQADNMSARIEPFSDPRIYLIGREAQGFDELLRENPVPNDLLDDQKDFSVFLVNNSDQVIVGYNVRWEIGDTGITQTRAFVDDLWLAMPHLKSGKGVLAPGSHRFVSCLQGVDSFWTLSNNPKETRMKAQDMAVKSAHTLRNLLKRAGQDWRVRIDGVILIDGRFIGENKGGFFEQTKAKVEADRDYYRDLVAGLDAGLNLEALLRERLTATQEANEKASGDDWFSAHAFYKRRQETLAEGLFNARGQVSEEKLADLIRAENRKTRAVIYK